MSALAGRTVAIVGASSGIGLATAHAVTAAGARAFLLARSREPLERAAAALPGARAVAADMLDPASLADAASGVEGVDHLVVTAVGDEYAIMGPLAELTRERIESSLDKLRGYVNVTKAFAPRLRSGGSMVLVSGAGALRPPAGTSLAAAANAAVASFGRALALELAPLRVNVVVPGVVDTPLHGERRAALEAWAASRALPVPRMGRAEEIADAIVFLLGNAYVTAQTLVVDGGYVAA